MWKFEMQSGNRTMMATESAATRSGVARSISSSARCTLSLDAGAIALFLLAVDSSRPW